MDSKHNKSALEKERKVIIELRKESKTMKEVEIIVIKTLIYLQKQN